MPFQAPPSPPPGSASFYSEAHLLSLCRQPQTPEANCLVDAVTTWLVEREATSRKNRRRKVGLDKLRRAVGAIVGEVLWAWGRAGKPPRAVWRSQQADKFTGAPVGRRTFETVTKSLKQAGLLHHKPGLHLPPTARFAMGQGREGRSSRYWPTLALLELAEGAGLTPASLSTAFRYVASSRPPKAVPPVNLRPFSRQDWSDPARTPRRAGRLQVEPVVSLEDTASLSLAEDVSAQNALAVATKVTGCLPPRWHRVFLGSWQLHGRWYATGSGPYWQMSSELRSEIRINRQPTLEIDVRASHLTLLHGLLGVPLPQGDLYGELDVPRHAVKQWVMETLGKGRPVERWARSTKTLPAASEDAAWVGSLVLQRLPCLRDPTTVVPDDLVRQIGQAPRFLVSPYLMSVEADAMAAAMRELRGQGILALPVHDSLIVQAVAEGPARQAIEMAYLAACGLRPVLSVKS